MDRVGTAGLADVPRAQYGLVASAVIVAGVLAFMALLLRFSRRPEQ